MKCWASPCSFDPVPSFMIQCFIQHVVVTKFLSLSFVIGLVHFLESFLLKVLWGFFLVGVILALEFSLVLGRTSE